MRISDWSSDVCSSDLSTQKRPSARGLRLRRGFGVRQPLYKPLREITKACENIVMKLSNIGFCPSREAFAFPLLTIAILSRRPRMALKNKYEGRSEEHTSELQSLMRNSYAVFCLKKTNKNNKTT